MPADMHSVASAASVASSGGSVSTPTMISRERTANSSSRLLAKFGRTKIVNPFDEEEKQTLLNMARGMSLILDMHNAAELSSLCGVLSVPSDGSNKEKKKLILRTVAAEVKRTHNPEKAYSDLLHLIWEGVLFEYLRAEGAPLRTANYDPRLFTLMLWRKQAQERREGAFRPHFVPRHVVTRNLPDGQADDIRLILQAVEQKELHVKHAESKVRKEEDYRNVILYLHSVNDMHNGERDARVYLIDELEKCRSRVAHQEDSLEVTMQQFEELEERHQYMGEGWCHKLAAQAASEDLFINMVSDVTSNHLGLAQCVREFVMERGGAEANGLTGREDLDSLLATLMARVQLDEATNTGTIQDTTDLLNQATSDLEQQGELLASETQRANDAEAELAKLRAKYEALQEGTARRLAQKDVEVSALHSLLAEHQYENFVNRQRFDMVRPTLEGMLHSDKAEDQQRGAQLLEGLGIMDQPGVLEQLELNQMRREDLLQRTHLAIVAAEAAGHPLKTLKSPKKAGAKK